MVRPHQFDSVWGSEEPGAFEFARIGAGICFDSPMISGSGEMFSREGASRVCFTVSGLLLRGTIGISIRILHRKLIVYVSHSGQFRDLLPATARLCGREFLFVSPKSRDPRVAFAFHLREDFSESRVIRQEKERTTEIYTRHLRTRAEPSDDVGHIYGEIADQILDISEIISDLIQRSVCDE